MSRSSRDLLASARAVVAEVTAETVHNQARSNGHVLLDVRERNEFEEGYIPGAVHLSKGFLETQIEDRIPDRSTPITLYCAAGIRSLLAGRALHEMGYENVEAPAGGFGAWKQKGYEFNVPKLLTPRHKNPSARPPL